MIYSSRFERGFHGSSVAAGFRLLPDTVVSYTRNAAGCAFNYDHFY